ncbi:MAG: DUF1330 domain-containing protein [Reyranella sp.]|nr:DUF1330 domain-containing protein [Reyranella sp.]
MTAYVIFDPGPRTDPEAMKQYSAKAFDTLVPYGGKVIVRTNNLEIRESNNGPGWRPTRLLIIEFPSMVAARAWYDSPEYQELLPIRLSAATENVVIVEGLPSQ